jgi:hypothetical protein
MHEKTLTTEGAEITEKTKNPKQLLLSQRRKDRRENQKGFSHELHE